MLLGTQLEDLGIDDINRRNDNVEAVTSGTTGASPASSTARTG